MEGPIFDGVKLMFMGMGTVVVFLVVMNMCMGLLKKVLAPIETILDPEEPKTAPKAPAAAQDDSLLAAAAAFLRYVQENNKPGFKGSVTVNGKSYPAEAVSADTVKINGKTMTVVEAVAAAASAAPASAPAVAGDKTFELKAPIPGTVMKIQVAAGDKVTAGSELFLLEAMKMETPICADFDAVVVSVNTTEKSVVAAEDVLAVLERI